MKKDRNSFSGSIGFVLAAAGSAVGLGNIWRFPYLAAKDGGGLFLVIYIILAVTFGFTLLTTEIAIGRKTKQSPLTAYGMIKDKFKFLGVLACLVPIIIMPYYCVIGGWVVKYFLVYLIGQGSEVVKDGYFTEFITSENEPIIFMVIFLALVAFIVFRGVNKGIENYSKILMPILLVLVVGISIFSMTISHTSDDGTVRTGLEGFNIYVVPNFDGLTIKGFFTVLLDAMGQLFFSLSVAMGIMVTYGSYVNDDAKLVKSINQIEIFDTVVAFLAGVMIIPTVYAFMGREGMKASGPSFMDEFHLSRRNAATTETIVALVVGTIVCFGYNKLFFDIILPNGGHAQILDVMDYISNNLFMPIVAIGTCILIGWIVKPKVIIDEVEKTGCTFGRKNYTLL